MTDKEKALEKVCELLLGNLDESITHLEDLLDQLYLSIQADKDMKQAVEDMLDHKVGIDFSDHVDMEIEASRLAKKEK